MSQHSRTLHLGPALPSSPHGVQRADPLDPIRESWAGPGFSPHSAELGCRAGRHCLLWASVGTGRPRSGVPSPPSGPPGLLGENGAPRALQSSAPDTAAACSLGRGPSDVGFGKHRPPCRASSASHPDLLPLRLTSRSLS